MARSKGQKRPFAPGAGQDAGRKQQQYPGTAEEHSFKGRNAGGQLHKRGEKRNIAPTPKPKAATPRPQPSVSSSTNSEAIAFSAMAARRGAPAPSAQRDRLVAAGIIKEVANVQ